MDAVLDFFKETGFYMIGGDWKSLVMIGIACFLAYLAIVKKFEPLLLLPIAFGMLLTNLPGANMFHEEFFADGHVHWDLLSGGGEITPGLIDYLYLGVKPRHISVSDFLGDWCNDGLGLCLPIQRACFSEGPLRSVYSLPSSVRVCSVLLQPRPDL